MKLITTVLFLICENTKASNIFSDQYAKLNYQRSLQETNEFLVSNISTLKSCPGVKLSITCGDNVCGNREDKNNCPADCIKGEIRSYNHEVICDKVKTVFTPKTEADFQAAIKVSIKNGMRVKVVGNLHSATNMLCNKSTVISTKNLNKVIGLEKYQGEDVVNVQAGVTIGELSEWLHERKKSLGYTMIGYRGVTVAGVTATAAMEVLPSMMRS